MAIDHKFNMIEHLKNAQRELLAADKEIGGNDDFARELKSTITELSEEIQNLIAKVDNYNVHF